MRRLIIKKLILISQSESKSLEVPFTSGLNIILGGNKTGKSSIMKSIFTTFGCECKRIEKEWQQLISIYMIFFEYGEHQNCIVRQGKRFQIFQNTGDTYSCIIDTEKFHEYSNCLMEVLEIKMPCISNSGEKINITPPLLFRFQYIDQDEGWNKIADSFRNSAYIHDWKPNTNKYVCGYLDDKYYELKAQKEEYISEKNDKEIALENNNSFVTRISNSIKQMNDIESVEEVTNNTKTLFEKAEELRKILFSINEQIILLENDIYINENKLRIVQYNQEESKKDIEFAMNQNNEIICPICGASYSNNLDNQLNITSDYSHCEKLIQELKGDIVISKTKLKELKNEYDSMALKIKMIEKDIHDSQELLSYSLFYKNRGQWEIYESCQKELEVLQTEIESLSLKINNTDKKINEKKSRKRSKEIQEEIKKYCRILADEINLPKTFIKLRDFVQVIDRTGSETPRLVYMYQSALYLYNLDKGISPFNFYVIDTPNQQGQDAENLESIFKSLEIFMNNRGQVIVGTERKTGLEKKVSNVIVLKEKRRCLNSDNFTNHLMLFKTLQKVANEWRNENIIRNK